MKPKNLVWDNNKNKEYTYKDIFLIFENAGFKYEPKNGNTCERCRFDFDGNIELYISLFLIAERTLILYIRKNNIEIAVVELDIKNIKQIDFYYKTFKSIYNYEVKTYNKGNTK